MSAGAKIIAGDEETKEQGIYDLKKVLPTFVPGGVQAKKTIEGIQAVKEGASLTPTGRKRFDVEQTPSNMVRGAVFGQFNLPGADEYFKNLGKSKSSIIVEEFGKAKTQEQKAQLWDQMVKEGRITKDNVSDVKKAFKDSDMKITKREKSVRSLPVKDGSRARMVKKQFDKAKTQEEKAALWQRYVDLGIMTKEVAKQVKYLLSQ